MRERHSAASSLQVLLFAVSRECENLGFGQKLFRELLAFSSHKENEHASRLIILAADPISIKRKKQKKQKKAECLQRNSNSQYPDPAPTS